MKLKKLSFWFSAVVMLVLAANVVFLFMIQRSYDSVVTAQLHRQNAVELADKLKEETEQLTSLVRTYTSTGEARYLTYYYDILAIREGRKPQPVNFESGAYWDQAIAGDIQHKIPAQGVLRSVSEHMKTLGFSAIEFTALNKITLATAAMKQMEQVAFAATQGLFDPATNAFVSDGEPHPDFATQLVYSKQYNALKADLSRSVLALGSLVDARTNEAVGLATHDLERWIWLMFCSVGIAVLMILGASRVISQRVLQPINALSRAASRLARGDYSTRITGAADTVDVTGPDAARRVTRSGGTVSELVSLGETLDGMAEAIERDIQLRQEAQHALEAANQKVEDATRAKSIFLANMSHEIRTPMNAIIGMAYLALRTDLTPRQHDYISKVHYAAKSLLGLLNDILDFSKIEAGKMELESVRFLLEDVVGNALSLLSQSAQEKHIELLFDVTDPRLLGEQGALLGDPLRLSQVLTNLLSNSVKFTERGFVRMSVRIDERTDDDVLLRFTVQDTGIGMASEQLARLFQEFTQADGSTTRKYGGTGLGLSISKKFVALMGGQIWADSIEGVGSEFHCTVRFRLALPVMATAAGVPIPDGLRVLVVDDRPDAALALIALFNVLGVGHAPQAPVGCAASGRQAMTMMQAAQDAGQPYDLLLLDWMMPDMNGSALLQELQGSAITPPLPVVISAYECATVMASAEIHGARHFLAKPVLPAALRRLLLSLNEDAVAEDDGRHEPASGFNLNGMRVLLVEDNPINQQLAVELMEYHGVQVSVAMNGREALDQLGAVAADHFHVVLMDLQMPVMDGYEATRQVRGDEQYAGLVIIAMTAHAMVEERDRCLAIGMNGHLSKPIEPELLYATLARHFTATGAAPAMSPAAQHRTGVGDEIGDEAATLRALPRIAGLDTTAGVRFSGGSQQTYLQLLSMFVAHYRDCGAQLADLLASAQWQKAEMLAHTLKGLAGTLGATALLPHAIALEVACRQAQPQAASVELAALVRVMAPMLVSLQQYFAIAERDPASRAAPAIADQDVTDGTQELQQLRRLLEEGDSDAIDLWAQHAGTFARMLSPLLAQRISTALQNFEFDVAQTLLAGGAVDAPALPIPRQELS